VLVNTIAPLAGSRMTETVLPPDLVAALNPDYVAPLVVFLCHESSKANGGVFELGAGWVSQVRFQRSQGVFFPTDASFTAEAVRDRFTQIGDFARGVTYPASIQDSMQPLIERLAKGGAAAPKPAPAAAAAAAPKPAPAAAAAAAPAGGALQSDALFEQIAAGVKAQPAVADKGEPRAASRCDAQRRRSPALRAQ
jgi:hypothetical protein